MTLSTSTAGLHVRYEKAGLILDALPIPWNADAVIVEANVRLPAKAPRAKQDFTLRNAADGQFLHAELIAEQPKQGRLRVYFRKPTPMQSYKAHVFWREHALGQVEVPMLTRSEFVDGFALEMPTLQVALGARTVACQAFVHTPAKTAFASAVVHGIGSLAAALDLDLCVQVQRMSGEPVGTVAVTLTSEQRRARQALVTVLLPRLRGIDTYRVSWQLAGRSLHAQTLRTVSNKTLVRSLRISATRFLVSKEDGTVESLRALPMRDGQLMLDGVTRIVPCFYVCSGEAGMAGIAPFTLRAMAGDVLTMLASDTDILVTDGPVPILLGGVTAAQAASIQHFSLSCGDLNLGNLPLVPALKADFNAEGGFVPLEDYLWSAAADEQFSERLGKLLADE